MLVHMVHGTDMLRAIHRIVWIWGANVGIPGTGTII